MGRRARKRGPDASPRPQAPASTPAGAPTRPSRRPNRDERPKAPWDPLPLAELAALSAIVFFVVALIVGLEDSSGQVLLVAALALGSLSGLDTALREHINGFRSHSLLLAALPAVLAAGILFFGRAPWPAVSATGIVVFAAAFMLFRRAFKRASGGLAWR